MKGLKLWSLIGASLSLIVLLFSIVPVYAQSPDEVELTNNKIRTDPYPLENELNPKSPNYNPSLRYAGEGTRFGQDAAPGETPFSKSGLRDANHLSWGTNLRTGGSVIGAKAKQRVYNDITLEDTSDYLYAPTLLPPNYCPLEVVTYYHKTAGGSERKFAVFDHSSHDWEYFTDINQTFTDRYVRSGYYLTMVDKIDSTWYACLWNYTGNYWDAKFTQTDSGDHSNGWDVWEEYELQNDWPVLPEIRSKELQVDVNNSWYDVTSTYGLEYDDPDFPPDGDFYDYDMVSDFYEWYVGP